MNKPLLSISIPTYNRSGCLKDCLNSIVSQFEDQEVFEQTEIVISNNASNDDTEEVVVEFQNKFSNIKYFKNETNIGFDRNLLKVVEKSSGEYCLTLGDDDGLFPNSLSVIIEKIKKYNVPYFILNCWGYDHDLIKPVLSHPNRQIKEDAIYESLTDFVKSIKKYFDIVGNFGGISTQLFKREEWIRFNKKEDYLDTQVVHLFILLSVFKKSKLVLLAKPLIKTRNDNMRWDICPGLETNIKRCNTTIKMILWIDDLYNLSLSPNGVKLHILMRGYTVSFKELIKKMLFKIGLRK